MFEVTFSMFPCFFSELLAGKKLHSKEKSVAFFSSTLFKPILLNDASFLVFFLVTAAVCMIYISHLCLVPCFHARVLVSSSVVPRSYFPPLSFVVHPSTKRKRKIFSILFNHPSAFFVEHTQCWDISLVRSFQKSVGGSSCCVVVRQLSVLRFLRL